MTLAVLGLSLAALACTLANPAPPPTPSAFDSGRTAYGFFPSAPEPSFLSVIMHFVALGKHADFVLVQPNIPWADVGSTAGKEPQRLTDIRNQVNLAYQNGLQVAFVVDPLNGLNRREFMGLPAGWTPSFANPEVRAAFKAFALWIARTYHPRYLGLASEINTYADAHPEDFANYLSLYRETYLAAKAESPETQIFVTFQWEDLNNLIPQAAEGRLPYQTDWEEVEAFEPQLDLWAISSYPFAVFKSGAEIPADYYTPLLTRTDKPLAVAEGGYTSRSIGPFPGTPQDQVDYLNAIHRQLGSRLRFWVYLLLSDFNPQSFADAMRKQGLPESDVNTLGMFSAVGLRQADGKPKPALDVWDGLREGR
jgi:hypothetical protein